MDLAPNPTEALPATWQKVEVLTQRARAGLALFHPDDARRDDPETRDGDRRRVTDQQIDGRAEDLDDQAEDLAA